MFKKAVSITLLISSVLLTGCATGLSPVGTGLITNVQGPITATDVQGSKKGEACATTILGLITTGNASIEAAKADGGITTVASVDYHTKGVYPFAGATCTKVTGN